MAESPTGRPWFKTKAKLIGANNVENSPFINAETEQVGMAVIWRIVFRRCWVRIYIGTQAIPWFSPVSPGKFSCIMSIRS
jgi:hypothetical protein